MKATGYWPSSGTKERKRSYRQVKTGETLGNTDRELYRERNLIERAFNKLKQWRRIATRYDRKSLYFLSALHLVASVIWG